MIWPVRKPTQKSEMNVSSVSPLLWDTSGPRLGVVSSPHCSRYGTARDNELDPTLQKGGLGDGADLVDVQQGVNSPPHKAPGQLAFVFGRALGSGNCSRHRRLVESGGLLLIGKSDALGVPLIRIMAADVSVKTLNTLLVQTAKCPSAEQLQDCNTRAAWNGGRPGGRATTGKSR